jgi:hypothetical protein
MNEEKMEYYKNELKYNIETLSKKSKRLVGDNNDKKINEIFNNYEKYRVIIHKYMDNNESEKLMDRHKIAAAFFCAILKSKPISYIPDSSGKDPLFCELRANEQAAFLFGVQILQDFIADKVINSTSADDKEIYKQPFYIPGTKDDSYIHWFVKLVVDGVGDYFDFTNPKFEEKLIFFISHIYFLLDNNSYQHHKINLLEKRVERKQKEYADLKKQI